MQRSLTIIAKKARGRRRRCKKGFGKENCSMRTRRRKQRYREIQEVETVKKLEGVRTEYDAIYKDTKYTGMKLQE